MSRTFQATTTEYGTDVVDDHGTRYAAFDADNPRAEMLGGYFLSLVDATMGVIEPDPKRLVRALERAAEAARRGRNPLDDGGIVALFATDEQRKVLDQVQALMSLLEGYSNHVMNAAGARILPNFSEIHDRFERRGERRGALERAIMRLTGLDLKMEQYAAGERFAERVCSR